MTKARTRRLIWMLAAAVAVVLGMQAGPALADPPEKIYVDIDEFIEGQDYGRWAADWWEWGIGTPGPTNPLVDMTGAFCDQRQVETDVWFLAGFLGDPGGPVVRECTVPEGRFLFFPLINSAAAAFLSDPPDERTEEFLRERARCEVGVELFLEVDGVEVEEDEDLQKLFTGASGSQSPLFSIQVTPDNLFGLPESVLPEFLFSPVAEEGYYIMLEPLAPGEHTIHWTATGCSSPDNTQDITYHVTVEGGEASAAASGGGGAREETTAMGGLRLPRALQR